MPDADPDDALEPPAAGADDRGDRWRRPRARPLDATRTGRRRLADAGRMRGAGRPLRRFRDADAGRAGCRVCAADVASSAGEPSRPLYSACGDGPPLRWLGASPPPSCSSRAWLFVRTTTMRSCCREPGATPSRVLSEYLVNTHVQGGEQGAGTAASRGKHVSMQAYSCTPGQSTGVGYGRVRTTRRVSRPSRSEVNLESDQTAGRGR